MADPHERRRPDACLQRFGMNSTQLEQECRTYGRYFIGSEPDPYVVRKYLDYHRLHGARVAPAGSFDRFLTDLSARHPAWTRLADAYASRFQKQAALRKKLVLTLALLECAPGAFEVLDAVDRGGVTAGVIRLCWRALMYMGTLLLALPLFVPVHVWTAVFAKSGTIPAMES